MLALQGLVLLMVTQLLLFGLFKAFYSCSLKPGVFGHNLSRLSFYLSSSA
jgi:hypothetical protein